MTVPRDRISYGYHTFPFFGLDVPGTAPHALPVLPIRVRAVGGQFGRPFNAILDTGSTRTLVPRAVATAGGLKLSGTETEVRVVGGVSTGEEASADLAIADAHYPEVLCWQLASATVIVMPDEALDMPILGWDTLDPFELIIDRRRERISLRLHADREG